MNKREISEKLEAALRNLTDAASLIDELAEVPNIKFPENLIEGRVFNDLTEEERNEWHLFLRLRSRIFAARTAVPSRKHLIEAINALSGEM